MDQLAIRQATIDDAKVLTELAYTTFWDAFAHHPKNAPDDLNHYMRQAFNVEQIADELADDKNIFLIGYVGEVSHFAESALEGHPPQRAGAADFLEIMRWTEALHQPSGTVTRINEGA